MTSLYIYIYIIYICIYSWTGGYIYIFSNEILQKLCCKYQIFYEILCHILVFSNRFFVSTLKKISCTLVIIGSFGAAIQDVYWLSMELLINSGAVV